MIARLMEKYRTAVGWGAVGMAALTFLPIPLPDLPPMLNAPMLLTLPLLGKILLIIHPMLLFAAGIGLIKGWDGGKKLFALWSALAIAAALVGWQYNYIFAGADLLVIFVALGIVYWGAWRKRS